MLRIIQDIWEYVWKKIMDGNYYCLDYLGQKFSKENFAYFMVFMSTIFLSISLLVIQMMRIDYGLITLFRGLFMVIGYYTSAQVTGNTVDVVDSGDFRQLLVRTLFASGNIGCFYFLVSQIPMSLINTISNLCPLFVFIFNYAMFGEQINGYTLAGFLSSFFGVFIIIMYKNNTTSGLTDFVYAQGNIYYFYIIFHLTNTILWGYSLVLIRQMKKMDNFKNSFFVGIGLVLIGAFSFVFRDTKDILSNLGIYEYLIILFVSFFGFLVQSLFFGAQFLAPKQNGQSVLIQYLNVIWSFVFEIFIFDEKVTLLVSFGSLLVLLGIYFIIKDKL